MPRQKAGQLQYASSESTKRANPPRPLAQFALGSAFCVISLIAVMVADTPFIPLEEFIAAAIGLLAIGAWYHVHVRWGWRWFLAGVISVLGLLAVGALVGWIIFIRGMGGFN